MQDITRTAHVTRADNGFIVKERLSINVRLDGPDMDDFILQFTKDLKATIPDHEYIIEFKISNMVSESKTTIVRHDNMDSIMYTNRKPFNKAKEYNAGDVVLWVGESWIFDPISAQPQKIFGVHPMTINSGWRKWRFAAE